MPTNSPNRVTITLPEHMFADLRDLAKLNNRTMSSLLVDLIVQAEKPLHEAAETMRSAHRAGHGFGMYLSAVLALGTEEWAHRRAASQASKAASVARP